MFTQTTHGGNAHSPLEPALAHVHAAGPAVVALVLLLVVAELALQVRAQIRYGQSVFNLVAGKPSYVYAVGRHRIARVHRRCGSRCRACQRRY